MHAAPDLSRLLKPSTASKVKLIVVLFVVIAVCLTGMIALQGNIADGVRAYVRGEGLWAKAQKDAMLALEHYAYSGEEADLAAFRRSTGVFRGDALARDALDRSPPDEATARDGFIQGGNAPQDVDSLVWFYLHFQNISYMREAIGIWKQGDAKMRELEAIAEQMRTDFTTRGANPPRMQAYRARLQRLGSELTALENQFSVVLGEGARWVKRALWLGSLAVLAVSIGIGLLISRQIIRSIARAEQALLLSESRFRSLKDSRTIGIASWNADGRFTDANDLLLDMLGYTRAELRAGAMNWKTMTPPECVARDAQALVELATQGYCEPYEKVLLHKNGARVPVYIGAAVIGGDRQNGIAYILDVSERRRAEEQLKLAAVVFDSSSNGVLITDASLRILSVNRALCEMTGFGREELIGRTPSVLRSGHTSAAQYEAIRDSLVSKGYWHGDIIDRSKSGALLPLSISVSRVPDHANNTTHYVAIVTDISERKAEEAQLWHMAHHDTLTGLPNRTLFNDRIEQLIKQAARNGTQFAVLFYDLDRFKPVNDRYGHEVGDKLLQMVAARLKTLVRDTDTVTRLGGDEFVILLTGIAGSEVAEQLLQKTVAAIRESYEIDGHAIEIGVSAGLSIFPDHGSDSLSLIRHADAAMYSMKQQGVPQDGGPAAHEASQV
jgi:diguanylate cyclase (GGDEF)-like protein/PAS domain S-box-containing protein